MKEWGHPRTRAQDLGLVKPIVWKYCIQNWYRLPSIIKIKFNLTPIYFHFYTQLLQHKSEEQGACKPERVLRNNRRHFAKCAHWKKNSQQVKWWRLSLKHKLWRNWEYAATGTKVEIQSEQCCCRHCGTSGSSLLGKKFGRSWSQFLHSF